MINNNYIPEWYLTPFDHSKYTLVRTQDQFDLLFEDMSDTQEFLHMGVPCQVDFYSGGEQCIVQLGDVSGWELIQIHSLLLHEAVHVWQKVRFLMGESSPSSEFEAYSIQRIAQDLFEMFGRSEFNDPR